MTIYKVFQGNQFFAPAFTAERAAAIAAKLAERGVNDVFVQKTQV
jgi:hypothetical protein